MRKKLWLLLISLLFLGMLVACGTASNNDQSGEDAAEQAQDLPKEKTEEKSAGSDEQLVDEGDAADETTKNETKEESEGDEKATITEDVTFNGLIDTHSIEVETSDGILVLQIAPDTMEEWGRIAPNTKLTVEYYTNQEGQNILVNHTINN